MPTLNKLEYLDETKQQIKTVLNTNFNSQISDDDTFRSYVSKINVIYDNWPKVTGEDTSITLNNTKKGKMLLATAPSELTQENTPTPDNPSEVQVIKGNNSIKIGNKNFLNFISTFPISKNGITFDKKNDGSLIINGTATTTFSQGFDVTQQNLYGTYTIKHNIISGSTNSDSYMSIQKVGGGNISDRVYGGDTFGIVNAETYTTINTATLYIPVGTSYNNYNVGSQLEKGSTPTPYVAHQEQVLPLNLPNGIEYCKIGNYEDEFEHDGDKWYLNKYIGKVVLDGTEDWVYGGYNDTYTYIINENISNLMKNTNIYSNYFASTGNNKITVSTTTDGKIVLSMENNIVGIESSDNNVTKKNKILTWLGTNNTDLYYCYVTPTHTEITDTTLISQLNAIEQAVSYDEQTNISQTNAELPFIISASALMKGGN